METTPVHALALFTPHVRHDPTILTIHRHELHARLRAHQQIAIALRAIELMHAAVGVRVLRLIHHRRFRPHSTLIAPPHELFARHQRHPPLITSRVQRLRVHRPHHGRDRSSAVRRRQKRNRRAHRASSPRLVSRHLVQLDHSHVPVRETDRTHASTRRSFDDAHALRRGARPVARPPSQQLRRHHGDES